MDCICPSVICANHLNLEKDLFTLEKLGVKKLHFDVMDNVFVPRFGLYPEQAEQISKNFQFDLDVHCMVREPYKSVTKFAKVGAKRVTIHAENSTCTATLLKFIKSYGMRAGMALNPATKVDKLLDCKEDPDYACIMLIEPGVLHGTVYDCYEKIKTIKNSRPSMDIQVDGGVTFDSAPRLLEAGATELVCGSATLFKKSDGDIENQYLRLLKSIS